MKAKTNENRIEPLRLAGLLLWRGGLAFTAAYAFFWGAWQFIQRLNWPVQITTGVSIALGGFGLVMLSLIIERYRAARDEGNLLDD